MARDVKLDDLLFQSGEATALGCQNCAELPLCGGLSVRAPLFNCFDLCDCADPKRCPYLCPKRTMREVVLARREVEGFDLCTLPQVKAVPARPLPVHVPLLKRWSGRESAAEGEALAIPLSNLFSGSSGRPRYADAGAVRQRFKISSHADLIIDGVSTDQPIENYWGFARDSGIVEHLRLLNPAVVTTPNFSMFADAPRLNDLYNMKRQVIAWHELTEAGIPAALHINARSDRDYQRFLEFIRQYEAVRCVSFEFGTGARRPSRRDWHIRRLCRLAHEVDRPLRIVVRGGFSAVAQLREHFSSVTMIDSTPVLKTMKRRIRRQDAPGYRRTFTLLGQPLDELLADNITRRREGLIAALSKPKQPPHAVTDDARPRPPQPDGGPVRPTAANLPLWSCPGG